MRKERQLEFIGTHCHILPGVDDGPADIEASLAMARMAVDDVISTVVATPHIIEGYYDGRDRFERLEGLSAGIMGAGIELRLIAGAEVPMSTCLAGDEERLRSLVKVFSRKLRS